MESLKEKILIVDDDENICEVIRIYLESANYDVKTIHDGGMVQGIFMRYKPDLVILDMMLPNIEGIDLLKWIRKEGNIPVIMLTAKGETFDKVLALDLGADDYVVKPFEPKELIARVKAVMRRYTVEDKALEKKLEFKDLIIDLNSYKVIYKGEELKMPP